MGESAKHGDLAQCAVCGHAGTFIKTLGFSFWSHDRIQIDGHEFKFGESDV